MEELERLLKHAADREQEAEGTANAAVRLVLLAQVAETWLHINYHIKKLAHESPAT